MKASIALLTFGASVAVLAQDLSSLSNCGKVCISNMISIAQSSFGCASGDIACACTKQNFGYGVRDCSQQFCTNSQDANAAIAYGTTLCQGAVASAGSSAAAGATTGALPVLTSALASASASASGARSSVTGSVASAISSAASSASASLASRASSASSAASAAVSSINSSVSGAISSLQASASSAAASAASSAASRASSANAAPMKTAMPLAGAAGMAALFFL